MSGEPKAIDGTLGKYDFIPIFLAKLTTGWGPTLSINLALIVLTELAKAFFNVLIFPYLSPEFLGHQGSTLPCLNGSIQNKASGEFHMEIISTGQ